MKYDDKLQQAHIVAMREERMKALKHLLGGEKKGVTVNLTMNLCSALDKRVSKSLSDLTRDLLADYLITDGFRAPPTPPEPKKKVKK